MAKYAASISTHGWLEFDSDHSEAELVEEDFWTAWADRYFGRGFQEDGTTLHGIELA